MLAQWQLSKSKLSCPGVSTAQLRLSPAGVRTWWLLGDPPSVFHRQTLPRGYGLLNITHGRELELQVQTDTCLTDKGPRGKGQKQDFRE